MRPRILRLSRVASKKEAGSIEKRDTATGKGTSSVLLDEPACYDFAFAYGNPSFSDRIIWLQGPEPVQDGDQAVVRKKVPVNSAIVAAKSLVFQNMLSNGMAETDKDRPVIVNVDSEQEERAVLEMLYFVYTGTFSTPCLDRGDRCEELVALLTVADKYGVAGMVAAVSKVWANLLDDLEWLQHTAFQLPAPYLQYVAVKSLKAQACDTLFQRFKEVTLWDDPVFKLLSLEGVSYLLGRSDLEAKSEEEVFTQTLAWVRGNFEVMEERQAAMRELCARIRFARMSGEFVQEHVIDIPEMAFPLAQRNVTEGLAFAASSRSPKELNEDSRFQARKPNTFVLRFEATLDAQSSDQWSPAVERNGATWHVLVRKQSQGASSSSKKSTVGVFLSIAQTDVARLTKFSKEVQMQTWVKKVADGKWALQRSEKHSLGPTNLEGGRGDVFAKSWEQVGRGEYVDASGKVALRVVVTVLSQA
ncbi:BTB/POZ/Kelch-associated protein [Klebsormidium nitens]|uniref:BTB/POZ/Kelch-associated protein n=1 Tax=Klebsormidium nitens TaxID=105231 RepID=A0A1Y1HUB4_KLENI|nr:BTB/POZ/Kelch-associated protein [Klebsormidium nitens]|eukprot:GAQ82220.1 BTB/POZ/Kelch-associated protein [Klebsormidium nitens]